MWAAGLIPAEQRMFERYGPEPGGRSFATVEKALSVFAQGANTAGRMAPVFPPEGG